MGFGKSHPLPSPVLKALLFIYLFFYICKTSTVFLIFSIIWVLYYMWKCLFKRTIEQYFSNQLWWKASFFSWFLILNLLRIDTFQSPYFNVIAIKLYQDFWMLSFHFADRKTRCVRSRDLPVVTSRLCCRTGIRIYLDFRAFAPILLTSPQKMIWLEKRIWGSTQFYPSLWLHQRNCISFGNIFNHGR